MCHSLQQFLQFQKVLHLTRDFELTRDESEFWIDLPVKYPGQRIAAGSDLDIRLGKRLFCQRRAAIRSYAQHKVTLEIRKKELDSSGKTLKCCARFWLCKASAVSLVIWY